MRKLIANPGVYVPTAIILLTTTLWVMFTWVGPAWGRWQHETTMAEFLQWSPEPWAITVDDFPAGAAMELAAQEEWLYYRFREPVGLGPLEMPGLEHVLDGLPPTFMYEALEAEHTTSSLHGVSVGDTEVYSLAGMAVGRSFHVDYRGSLYRHQARLASRETDPDTWAEGVIDYEAIGSRLTDEDWEWENIGARDVFHPGEAGYYGNRVVVIDEVSGEQLEVVGVATVADDAFIAVGTVTPVGVEPDADAVELLELLADKVRADPPEVAPAVGD